jgi:hypothetical protein
MFNINDVVEHDELGTGIITGVVPHAYNKKIPEFYIVSFDNIPSISYNGGNRECLIYPNELEIKV